jgi:hypothetical protein
MKTLFVCALVAGLLAVVGCQGEISEGDSCGGSKDNCENNLTCQPIAGHGDVCCPTPPSASEKGTCQAVAATN